MTVDVMYFDYWTRGIRHFSKIDDFVRAAGLSSLLVHLGSQRGELAETDQIISGVKCADISFYDSNLVTMLQTEKPRVVLLLNNQTEDKIIIRACRNMGIKTVFLMHGVLSTKDHIDQGVKIIDSAFGISDRLNRLPKYVRLFRQYVRAAMTNDVADSLDHEIYLYLLRQAISPGGNLLGKWIYKDSCADFALVYSENDRVLFASKFGYSEDRVDVVGNYNLDDLYYVHELKSNTKETVASVSGNYIVYVENGFSDPKFTVSGWTEDLVADEVEGLASVCEDLGYQLILKLHPSSDYSTLVERVAQNKIIKTVLHCDLAELIVGSFCVLGQSSSVLMMALAVRKPVIILDIPPLDLKGTFYKDQNLGLVVKSIEEFREVLLLQNCDRDFRLSCSSSSLDSFIGVFDGKASQRIANNVISLACGTSF